MNFTKRSIVSVIAMCCSSTLLAQNQINEKQKETSEIITVTGTHIIDSRAQAGIAKVIINADEIKASAPNNLADALRGVAGIDIFEQSGLTFLSVRGGDPNFVTIIIDGVKVNDPTNSRGGAFDLSTLDPNLIEKVEVFYGSHSTMFGSDALSGVISIQTKGYEEGKLGSISVKAGSNDSLGGSFHLSTLVSDYANLTVSGAVQDGNDSNFGDEFKRHEIISSLRSINLENTKWDMGVFFADGQTADFPEDSGGDRLSIIRTPEMREYQQTNLSANLQHSFNQTIRIDFNSAWSEREEDISNPGIAPGELDGVPAIDSNSNYQRIDLNTTANYLYSKEVSMAFGLAYAAEDGNMDSVIDFGFPMPANYSIKRKTNSVYGEFGYDPIEKLNITLAIRHDQADSGNETDVIKVNTHRLISNYQVNDSTELSFQYSEGFKMPSFFAVAHPLVGNPELKPELSENIEISLKNRFLENKLSTTTSLYKTDYTDLVDFDPIDFINVNRAKVEATGAEFSFNFTALENLSVAGNISYNKIDTFEPEIVLRRRPEFKSSLSVNYQPVDVLSLFARVSYNDDYFDSSVPTGMIEVDSFYRVDASASWSLRDDINLRLNIENLLNGDYEEAVGFSNRGTNLTFSITKDF